MTLGSIYESVIHDFGDVSLGEERTLLECDFVDSSGLGFSESIDRGFFTKSALIEQVYSISRWPAESKKYAASKINGGIEYSVSPGWAEISWSYLSAHSHGISYLSPAAYRFYIAAFIAAYFREGCVDSLGFSLWIDSLNPVATIAPDISYDEGFLKRISMLDLAQRRVVAEFFRFLMDANVLGSSFPEVGGPEMVFYSFWSSYLED